MIFAIGACENIVSLSVVTDCAGMSVSFLHYDLDIWTISVNN